MKKYLIILNQAPFKNSISLEAQELSLALAAFDQEISLLFINEGVLQLLPTQKTEIISHKNFNKTYTGLDLFDIKQVYLEQEALEKNNLKLENLNIQVKPLSNIQIATLIQQHDIILTV